jgi:hypothetical protein
VLQGGSLGVSETKPKDVEGSKDAIPDFGKHQDKEGQTKNPEAEVKTLDPPKKQNPKTEIKTPEPPKRQSLVNTLGRSTKQIGEPITSITPLQSTQRSIEEGWIFNEELRPIRAEELSPNEFFSDKKRKEVVKREFYQEGESTAKKFKVMTDGKNKKNEQFTTEIAGTLGAYASANQFSVGPLKNQLKRKNHLIKTLEARLASTTENSRGQVSVEIEQARLADKNEIEVLKTKLEQAHLVVRDGRIQAGQQRIMIEELQA